MFAEFSLNVHRHRHDDDEFSHPKSAMASRPDGMVPLLVSGEKIHHHALKAEQQASRA
jgi:hypothetical protein